MIGLKLLVTFGGGGGGGWVDVIAQSTNLCPLGRKQVLTIYVHFKTSKYSDSSDAFGCDNECICCNTKNPTYSIIFQPLNMQSAPHMAGSALPDCCACLINNTHDSEYVTNWIQNAQQICEFTSARTENVILYIMQPQRVAPQIFS